MSTVLCIGDLHAPFMHPKAARFLKELKQDFRPDVVVSLGDVTDQLLGSKFTHDPNGPSANEEFEGALEQLHEIYDIFPNVSVCLGNHDLRFVKRCTEAGVPSFMIRQFKDVIEAPKGWKFAKHFNIEGIRFTHGEEVSGRSALVALLQLYRANTVIGHLHSLAGVQYMSNGENQCWAMATGCLVDAESIAFAYGQNFKDKPVCGAGLIINGVPTWIPIS